MIKKEFNFGTLKIYSTYMISEFNKDIKVTAKIAYKIIDEGNKHFNGKQWGYISNRFHTYTVNPAIYTELLKLRDTIVAYAVVSYRKETELVVLAEQAFIGSDYDFQVFDNLNHAIAWTDSVVKQTRNKTE
jgi:hypothetical protein